MKTFLLPILVLALAGGSTLLTTGCGYTPPPEVEETKILMDALLPTLEQFKKEHKRYPAALKDMVQRPNYVSVKAWPAKGYLQQIPKDAWGTEFVYRSPGMTALAYDLISLGSDGKWGGKNDAQDFALNPASLPKKK